MTLAELIRCGIMLDRYTTITITKTDAEDEKVTVRGNMRTGEILALADQRIAGLSYDADENYVDIQLED